MTRAMTATRMNKLLRCRVGIQFTVEIFILFSYRRMCESITIYWIHMLASKGRNNSDTSTDIDSIRSIQLYLMAGLLKSDFENYPNKCDQNNEQKQYEHDSCRGTTTRFVLTCHVHTRQAGRVNWTFYPVLGVFRHPAILATSE